MTNLEQIITQPNKDIVIKIQSEQVNNLNAQLTVMKAQLEGMTQYAAALESNVKDLAEKLNEYETPAEDTESQE